ncbi:MAG TPA: hypothetical protein PKZ19_16215, partial [Zoogloea sp.]|nr:hypothetical protein [Zoogloea sp.]
MSTSQKPKNRPFKAKSARPGQESGRQAPPSDQGGRRGRGRPDAEGGGRGGRPPRGDDEGRQPKSNASAIGLSDLGGGGRGNWRAKRQPASVGGGTSPYPLASSELLPAVEGERRRKPEDSTYTEPQRLHKVLAAAGIGSRREI